MTNYENVYSSLNPSSLLRFSKSGFAQYQDSGLPTRKDEDWKYTDAKQFVDMSLQIPLKTSSQQKEGAVFELSRATQDYKSTFKYSIVLQDGFFIKEKSQLPKDVVVQSLQDDGKIFSYHSETFYREIKCDSFFHLNEAFCQDGILIELARNQVVEEPIEIVHISTKGFQSFPRVLIKAGVMSEIRLVERFISSTVSSTTEGREGQSSDDETSDNKTSLSNSVTEIFAESGAQVQYVQTQEENFASRHIGHINAIQNNDSRCQITTVALGGETTRFNVNTRLLGRGAFGGINSLYLTKEGQHVDHCTVLDHVEPHCESGQLAKGVLSGRSRSVFNCLVRIRKEAQKTNSQQLNKNLLLDPQAEADTRPQLQIDADDVKAAHGATVGQLNDDEVFYLQSRAIGKEQAVQMLSLGFVEEVLFEISDLDLRHFLHEKVKAHYAEHMVKGKALL